MSIRTYIADDHPVFRHGLERYFTDEPDFEVIGIGADGQEAVTALEDGHKADIAILDLVMPNLTGVEVAKRLSENKISTKIVLLTGTERYHLIFEAMQAGVAGFLLKTSDWAEVARAARDVNDGAVVVAPSVMSVLQSKLVKEDEDEKCPLSNREREVVTLVGDGFTATQIGEKLVIAEATVRMHLRHVREKLDVRSQSAAVAAAIRKGFIK